VVATLKAVHATPVEGNVSPRRAGQSGKVRDEETASSTRERIRCRRSPSGGRRCCLRRLRGAAVEFVGNI
jgi:hypothetical protein